MTVTTFRASVQGQLRDRLLDSAQAQIEKRGWSSVTMSRIADEVGVSRQTVHNELGTKRQLAEHLAMRELARFLEVVRDRMAGQADVVDAVVAAWRADPSLDYVSTVLVRSLPHGLDVELVTADALRRVDAEATGHHRVHVTSGVWTRPERYAVMGLCFAPDASAVRVTLDTPEDLAMLRAVVAARGTSVPSRSELVRLFRERPELAALTADVRRKALADG